MTLSPQKLREIVFQLLYSSDFVEGPQDDAIPFFMDHHEVSKKNLYIAEAQRREITTKFPEIDELLRKTITEYNFDKISRVEKNILRLAVYELLFVPSVPPKVAIAEAIRLARKFASPEAASFINAVLDSVYKNRVQGNECNSKQEGDSTS
jgi:N utilization substance protein B